MQGFVDLIAEADGRYWILDYKTNDLGPKVDDYHVDALRAAVAHGQYDLQYLIYLVALHRHLGRTLPGYDPEAHLGGAQYLFLRGMNGRDASTGVFVDRPDPNFLIALDGLFAGRGGTR
jgi:exodeoxyribonuclease V beta subunit